MAVYKTWEEVRSIPLDTPIWACAYAFDNNKETMGLKQEPIQGAIRQARQMYFFPFRKGSTTEYVTSKKFTILQEFMQIPKKNVWLYIISSFRIRFRISLNALKKFKKIYV